MNTNRDREYQDNYRSDESQNNLKESSNKYMAGSMNSNKNSNSQIPQNQSQNQSQNQLHNQSQYNYQNQSQNNQRKVNRLEAHEYEKKIQELSEKLEILENRIKTTNDQKMKILQRLKDTDEENERMRDQITRQASNNQRLNEKVNFLNNKNQDLQSGSKNSNEKFKTKFEILNKELEERENQLEKIITQIKAKDETIKYFSVNNEQTIRNQNLYKDELENYKEMNKTQEQKIRILESNIDELYINRKSEATLLLEIEHLKEDNIRLLQLLKSTEEFRDFAYLAENVTGGIKFVKSNNENNFKRSKSSSRLNISATTINSKNKKNDFIKECDRKKIEGEDPFNSDNWVPLDAFKLCYDFRNKYHIDMSETLINDLLKALNKIWREREQKQINIIKTKLQTEIMTLRRKMNMRTGYDEFTAGKTIHKLKKDLKSVRDDLRTNLVEKNKLKNTPAGIDLVDNALKIANNFQKTKKNLESEINLLKNKLNEKENKNYGENFERLKFNEGSFWIIGRVLDEMKQFSKILDELYSEFEERIKNVYPYDNYSSGDINDFNNKVLTNSKRWYSQSMKESLEDVIGKFEKWHFDLQKSFDILKYSY